MIKASWAVIVLLAGCSDAATPAAASGAGGKAGSGAAENGAAPASDGAASAPTFPADPLSKFDSPDGALHMELRTLPDQPIHVGPDNEGQLVAKDASGEPVDGLSISVTTWMPVMKHTCSAAPVHVKPQGNGVYLLTPLVASMPGKCELKLSIAAPLPDGGKGPTTSVVTPTFEVAQQ